LAGFIIAFHNIRSGYRPCLRF